MRLIDRFSRPVSVAEERAGAVALMERWTTDPTRLLRDFETFAVEGLMGSAPIWSLIHTRALAFCEVEFKFQRLADRGLFGSPALLPIERPSNLMSQRELLTLMEVDVSLAGEAFIYRARNDLTQRLRPDWVRVAYDEAKAEVIGYVYKPGGPQSPDDGRFLLPDEVAHYAPIRDPLNPSRGVSWMKSIAGDADADTRMSRYKNQFFNNAATPNLVVKVQGELAADDRRLMEESFARRYGSVENAYKTVIIDEGASIEAIGNTMEQIAFSETQSSGEARLAAAAGVPPQIVGFVKGLAASTYTNYGQAMRRFADLTLRPLWGHAATALDAIVQVPPGARLWYDDRYIPFLQQDATDEAQIKKIDAGTIRTLSDGGYEPASVIEFVTSGDPTRLVHTGKPSVQLQKTDQQEPSDED